MNYFVYKLTYYNAAGDSVSSEGIVPARTMEDAVKEIFQTYAYGEENITDLRIVESEYENWPSACFERRDIENIKWIEGD